MKPIEEATAWRLYLVREFLSEAVQLSGNDSPTARMRLVLTADQAVELLASTVLTRLNQKVKRDASMGDLMSQLCALKPSLQSHDNSVGRLRRLRDRVQHDGVVPSREDARVMLAHAEAFIRDAVREVMGGELEEFSPISQIADEEARKHLIGAMEALKEADYSEAVANAAVAFEFARRNYVDRHPQLGWRYRQAGELADALGEAVSSTGWQYRLDPKVKAEIQEFGHNLSKELRVGRFSRILVEVVDEIEASRYGISSDGYARYRRIIPSVRVIPGGDNAVVQAREGWSATQRDALFIMDFVTRSILQQQELAAKEE